MSNFVSLVGVLQGWFGTQLADLPDAIRERIKRDFMPMPWDNLSAEQRQSVALQWDYNHDPATEQDRQFWFDFFEKKGELEEQIAEWQAVAAPTVDERAKKERRVKELQEELRRMQKRQEQARGDFLVASPRLIAANAQSRYIAYPKAIRRLEERLNSTLEELAAWILMGPENGGIAAYRNANELEPPPRFHFDYYMGGDYQSPMMGTWFLVEDIEGFHPVDRYITGKALIARWSEQPGIKPEAFIQAKIEESRLIDLHPTYGGTRGTISEDDAFPPLGTGLFPLAQVTAIEAEDFGEERGVQDKSAATPCMPVSALEIQFNFPVFDDLDASHRWWKEKMANAGRYGLLECRAGGGKKGPGGSLWRPDLVGAWLVDRHSKKIDGLSAKRVKTALAKFTGCKQVADQFFPDED